tara:strand:+ start:507 stop:764 length:258 start_codon:yes stop_codon:yes gene_type:complete
MKITEAKLKQIIKEEVTKILNEISDEDIALHSSLASQAQELLQLSRETSDINEKANLMAQARKLLNQAADITTAASAEAEREYAE